MTYLTISTVTIMTFNLIISTFHLIITVCILCHDYNNLDCPVSSIIRTSFVCRIFYHCAFLTSWSKLKIFTLQIYFLTLEALGPSLAEAVPVLGAPDAHIPPTSRLLSTCEE